MIIGNFTLTRIKRAFIFCGLAILSFLMLVALIGCGGSETGGVSGPAATGSVSLSWQAPTTNEDGTLLTDLAGFRVYYGTGSGVYTRVVDAGSFTACDIGGLIEGTSYYFAVTAYDTSGNESGFSEEISVDVGVGDQS